MDFYGFFFYLRLFIFLIGDKKAIKIIFSIKKHLSPSCFFSTLQLFIIFLHISLFHLKFYILLKRNKTRLKINCRLKLKSFGLIHIQIYFAIMIPIIHVHTFLSKHSKLTKLNKK